MKNEQFEKVEDLINSDLFYDWVFYKKKDAFWLEWQSDNDQRKAMVIEAKAFLQQLSFHKETANTQEVDKSLEAIWSQINTQPKQLNPKLSTSTNYRWMGIAASVLFLIVAGWFISNHFLAKTTIYTTNFGETQQITLPDNSQVVLQANSTLKVPKNWSTERDRKVWLAGEAFFDVTKKQASTPIKFIVDTDNFSIEVLGTQFNVLARDNNKRVNLQEGKIKFLWGNQRNEIALVPNEMIAYSKEENQFKKLKVEAAIYTAWKEQKLILNNTPLSEIARILEENYGYQVRFAPSVNRNRTKSSVGAISTSNIDNLITIIEASYEVEINKNNQLITIN